jgi:hypothetical protein
MVISQINLDRMNDSRGPFNNKGFKPILLVQISVHELLHCFNRKARIFTFRVILNFLLFHIANYVLQLF